MQNGTTTGAVYLQTNDAEKNELVAYARAADGSLSYLGAYATGGRGTGEPHLPSQSSVVLGADGRWLLVANPGSDEISLFAVADGDPSLSDTTSSGGSRPTSIAVDGQLVYVLNNGSASIDGFEIADGKLRPLPDSKLPLSADTADAARRSPSARTVRRSSSPSAAPTASALTPSTIEATRTVPPRSPRPGRRPTASASRTAARSSSPRRSAATSARPPPPRTRLRRRASWSPSAARSPTRAARSAGRR